MDWYLARDPRVAAGFVDAVGRAAESIRQFPDAHPWYDSEHRFIRLRKYPFTVYYKPGNPPRVIAVAHNRQRLGYWHGRP